MIKHQIRDAKGKYANTGFTSLERHLLLFIALAIVAGYAWHVIKPVEAKALTAESDNCTLVGDRHWDCSDPVAKAKWADYQADLIKKQTKELGIIKGDPKFIFRDVCEKHGYTDDCWKILYGMAMQESGITADKKGDSDHALGAFQINDIYNKVPDSCRKNIRCSAEFSLTRMESLGFKTNRDNAIRQHNGSLDNPVTEVYLQKVKAFAASI